MATRTTYIIECDSPGCTNQVMSSDNMNSLKAAALRLDWRVAPAPERDGLSDYCPRHRNG